MSMRGCFQEGVHGSHGILRWTCDIPSLKTGEGGGEETLPHRNPDQNMNLWREGFTTFV